MGVTLADRIITFNDKLDFKGDLPDGYQIINPFIKHPETREVMCQFYQKFYSDNRPRKFIVGINPGRFGAGLTGVPFTDTKHLKSHCGITMNSAKSHETSGLFVYDLISAYGGVEAFYGDFYIHNAFPLGIVRKNKKETWVNANYYDSKKLFEAVKPMILRNFEANKALGLNPKIAFVLGKKNLNFLQQIKELSNTFEKWESLPHPRYIQQYKTKEKPFYIKQFLECLNMY